MIAQYIEAGFRAGFAEGVEHGYVLGTLVTAGIATIATSVWGFALRRHYVKQLNELRASVDKLASHLAKELP